MNNELKRVGLVFNADGTVDFVKSLQTINASLRENYTEFQKVQSQWDNSTKTSEKLAEKQKYLTNAYESQKDKVMILRKELEELQSAEEHDEKAIANKQAALNKAETALNKYGKELDVVTAKLKSGSEQWIETGKKIEEYGNVLNKAADKTKYFSLASAGGLTVAAKSAMDFEDAWMGVEKTVDGTEKELNTLKNQIIEMSKELPFSTTEIARVAEAAGQLGIKTENIASFTKVMLDMSVATNMSADDAATSMAKIANIMQMSQKDFDKMGATIVHLGNNGASTEKEIVDMALRIAGAGKTIGLSEANVLAYANALSSLGIEAEMGGSAISKMMINIEKAVATGDGLISFAKVAGMSAKDFATAWETDPAKALATFIEGLGQVEKNGGNLITVLEELDIKEVRLRDTTLRLANAGTLFSDSIEMGNKAWKENNALTNEANKRYDTTSSKMKTAINNLKEIARQVGEKLMPVVTKILDKITEWGKAFSNLNDSQVETIVKIGLFVAALSPMLKILGTVTTTVGGVVKSVGTFKDALNVMETGVRSASNSTNMLASVIGGITSPAGLAVTAIAGVTAVIGLAIKSHNDHKKAIEDAEGAYNRTIEAHQKMREEIDKNAAASLYEIDNIEKLKNELNTLVDENGKVKEGYKGRVDFILNELSKSLEIETSMTGDVINGHKKLQDEIDKTILKKKLSIILTAQEEKYTEAIKNQTEAYDEMVKSLEDYEKQQQNVVDLQKIISDPNQNPYEVLIAKTELKEAKISLIELEGIYKGKSKIYEDYKNDMAKYNSDMIVMMNGTVEEQKKLADRRESEIGREGKSLEELGQLKLNQTIADLNLMKSYYQASLEENDIYNTDMYAQQVSSYQKQLDELKNNLVVQSGEIQNMTPVVKESWKALAEGSKLDYYEVLSTVPADTRTVIESITGVAYNSEDYVALSFYQLAKSSKEEYEKTINQLPDSQKRAIDNIVKEIEKSKGNVNEKAKTLAEEFLKQYDKLPADVQKLFGNVTSPMSTELEKAKPQIEAKAKEIAKTVSETLRGSLNIHSPSRVTEEIFTNVVKGMIKGLEKEEDKLYNKTEELADNVIDTLDIEPKINFDPISSNNANNIGSFAEFDYYYNQQLIIQAIITALSRCKIQIDDDGFIRLIDRRLLEVM